MQVERFGQLQTVTELLLLRHLHQRIQIHLLYEIEPVDRCALFFALYHLRNCGLHFNLAFYDCFAFLHVNFIQVHCVL